MLKKDCNNKLNLHISGFTLAEVLITLGIIGVVAALTIPPLMTSYEKHVIINKVKEAYTLLSQATNSINIDCAGDIANCITSPTANTNNDDTARAEVASLYKPNLMISKDCTAVGATGCFASGAYKYLSDTTGATGNAWDGHTLFDLSQFIMSNGMSFGVDWNGLPLAPVYFQIFIDINGISKPNQYGKDLFYFYYDSNKKTLLPLTDNGDCDTTHAGCSCTNKIFKTDSITYY